MLVSRNSLDFFLRQSPCCAAQAALGLEFLTLSPPPLECWGYKQAQSSMANIAKSLLTIRARGRRCHSWRVILAMTTSAASSLSSPVLCPLSSLSWGMNPFLSIVGVVETNKKPSCGFEKEAATHQLIRSLSFPAHFLKTKTKTVTTKNKTMIIC